jgi:hypothetical protein
MLSGIAMGFFRRGVSVMVAVFVIFHPPIGVKLGCGDRPRNFAVYVSLPSAASPPVVRATMPTKNLGI